jgi:hypothetical protein
LFFAVTSLLSTPVLPVACPSLFVKLELFEVGSSLVHFGDEKTRDKMFTTRQKERMMSEAHDICTLKDTAVRHELARHPYVTKTYG